ncbi:MAG: CheR family methyltransferase [Gemmatimonadales bacterium]
MGQDLPDEGLRTLLAKIERRGLSVSSYREPCLRRRLAVRMRARGVHTFGDYASLLDRVPEELDLLLDALTINVTKFFRNPETYAVLRERVVKDLAAQNGRVAAWSAGCATGEEAYSLAILFAAAGGTSRVRIDATDLDPGALATLERAEYSASAIDDVPKDLAARSFEPGGPPFRVVEGARRLVRAVRHDLTRDAAPSPPYHLIVCRNVVIYFDRPTQERLFERFYEALAPGGWLLLGKVETLFGTARARFRTEDARERLFRRPA